MPCETLALLAGRDQPGELVVCNGELAVLIVSPRCCSAFAEAALATPTIASGSSLPGKPIGIGRGSSWSRIRPV
jgi:hypothetical protein